jgi:hypothetical protein
MNAYTVTIIGAVMLLTACTPTPASPAPSASLKVGTATATAPTPMATQKPQPVALPQTFTLPAKSAAEPQTSVRGLVIKKPGELTGYTAADGVTPAVNFTVGKITPNFKCTSEHPKIPANGHFIAVEMLVQNAPGLQAEADPYLHTGAGTWRIIGSNGVTINTEPVTAAGLACAAPVTRLPEKIGPGEKARGLVILDAPVTKGTITLTPPALAPSGWEWAF